METDETYRQRAGAMAAMLTRRPERHDQYVYGRPEKENECGTAGCVAGWGMLAQAGIVTIGPRGGMTWNRPAVGPVISGRPGKHRDDFTIYEAKVPTLWRAEFQDRAHIDGRRWLGLTERAAKTLFETTMEVSFIKQDAADAAVMLLRMLADGRLPRNFVFDADTLMGMLRDERHRRG